MKKQSDRAEREEARRLQYTKGSAPGGFLTFGEKLKAYDESRAIVEDPGWEVLGDSELCCCLPNTMRKKQKKYGKCCKKNESGVVAYRRVSKPGDLPLDHADRYAMLARFDEHQTKVYESQIEMFLKKGRTRSQAIERLIKNDKKKYAVSDDAECKWKTEEGNRALAGIGTILQRVGQGKLPLCEVFCTHRCGIYLPWQLHNLSHNEAVDLVELWNSAVEDYISIEGGEGVHDSRSPNEIRKHKLFDPRVSCRTLCGRTRQKSWCSGCKQVQYCGPECQKRDWGRHKPFCQSNKADEPSSGEVDRGWHAQESFAAMEKSLFKATDHVLSVPKGFANLSKKRFCAKCNTFAGKLQKCAKCKQVSYCSRECQVGHWPEHKLACCKKEEKKRKV